MALLIAAARSHMVRSTVLSVRLAAGDIVVDILRVVVRAAAHALPVRRELRPYFENFLDPWGIGALPDVDEVVVRDFPKDEEYYELKSERKERNVSGK